MDESVLVARCDHPTAGREGIVLYAVEKATGSGLADALKGAARSELGELARISLDLHHCAAVMLVVAEGIAAWGARRFDACRTPLAPLLKEECDIGCCALIA